MEKIDRGIVAQLTVLFAPMVTFVKQRASFSSRKREDLGSLLESTRISKTPRLHDRIYSLLGLTDAEIVSKISVDCQRPLFTGF